MNLRPSGYEPDELPDCSTPLLEEKGRILNFWSERPGSNRRPSAWKADALPTELLSPHQHHKSDANSTFCQYNSFMWKIIMMNLLSKIDTLIYHSRESENPLFQLLTNSWIPAFAGMTTFFDSIYYVKKIKKSIRMR